jgi:hypothetical protein
MQTMSKKVPLNTSTAISREILAFTGIDGSNSVSRDPANETDATACSVMQLSDVWVAWKNA